MTNLRLPILVSSIFFLVIISSSNLFAKPGFASRVSHSLVQEEAKKTPEYIEPEEPEIPEEPEVPEEPEIPEEPEVPEEPEEPEEPPKKPEEPKFGFPSWFPSFPYPGVTEKTKPTATVEEVPEKSSSLSEETSSGSNKKP